MESLTRLMGEKVARELIERWRRERFVLGAKSPIVWKDLARRHKNAADVLFATAQDGYAHLLARLAMETETPPAGTCTSRPMTAEETYELAAMDSMGVYYLLVGFALENLLKGYLLHILPELVRDDRRLDKLLTTHDLGDLCRDAGVSTSVEESEILRRLSRIISWEGRYPVSIYQREMPVHEEEEHPTIRLNVANHWPRMRSMIDSLYGRLYGLLSEA